MTYNLASHFIPGGQYPAGRTMTIVNTKEYTLKEESKYGLFQTNDCIGEKGGILVALSDSEDKLKQYCIDKYSFSVGERFLVNDTFTHYRYYVVREYNIAII